MNYLNEHPPIDYALLFFASIIMLLAYYIIKEAIRSFMPVEKVKLFILGILFASLAIGLIRWSFVWEILF